MLNKILTLAVLATLSGCSSVLPNYFQMKGDVNSMAKSAVNEVTKNGDKYSVGLNHAASKNEIPANVNNNWDADRGNFSVSASGKLVDVVSATAKRAGYSSIMFVDGIDKSKFVTASFSFVSPEFAMRKLAWSAGYVAVIDKKSKSVTITDQAVYTFKLASNVFNQLTQSVSASYSAGSGGGSGGGAPGVAGGGSSGGGSGNSSFSISGKTQGGSSGGTGMAKFIQSLAGKNAEVSVNEDMGMITVRSNAVALERVRQTLNKMAESSSRRVAVEATFIEVGLGDTFEYGIDWSRVLSGKTFGINGGAVGKLAGASANYQYTFGSITSIVTALKQYTDVTVMSQPKIETGNRQPTTFFDGFSLPYLGSVQSTQQQTSTSTSGTVSYADDGVRLSFVPDIVADNQVQFMLVPSLNSVGAEKTFDLGGGSKLTDFIRSKKEALLTVDLEDGQTAIIGGLRSSKASGNQTGIPGISKKLAIGSKEQSEAREVVMLLHANIIPGKPQDTLFAESL